ncbi:MAG TPA: helix-turn-helix domain-containing protein [bacterium]|nr:helix-turn-helix domain-containing protein [bacterium]
MSLNKMEIRKKYSDIDTFLKKEKDKHTCQCGCDTVIELKKSHYWNGIPKFIFGHAARLRKGTKTYDHDTYYSVEDIAELADVSDQTVRLWNRNKKIKAAETIGRKKLYRKQDIQKFLKDRPKREAFDASEYYTVQDLKRMGVSRSKLRSLVRAGKISEPRHHARKTHYLKTEIEAQLDKIMDDQKQQTRQSRISKPSFNKLKKRIKDLETRVKTLEDCLLRG